MNARESELVALVKEQIALTLEVAKEVFDEQIAPMLKFGSIEKVMEKPYEEWQENEFMTAQQIFGAKKLEDFIAPKEIADMYRQEAEEV
jgi:hypothetical protein